MNYKTIDQKAITISQKYKKCEAELLQIIMEVDQYKVYRRFNYPSLFQYVVGRLQLSEAQAYNFINVARKSKEVPVLKETIKKGQLTVSKAKKITSVITPENQEHWINIASTLPQKKIEREVALASPNTSRPEKTSYVAIKEIPSEKATFRKDLIHVKLEVDLPEELFKQLKRVQDLVSQKNKKTANFLNTIETLIEDYLKKHDPIEKAKRSKKRKQNSQSRDNKKHIHSHMLQRKIEENADMNKLSTKSHQNNDTNNNHHTQVLRTVPTKNRRALSANLKHQVYLKTGGVCTAKSSDGERCGSTRFLEIHHIQPISKGGQDKIENLTLLCSGHHKAIHQ